MPRYGVLRSMRVDKNSVWQDESLCLTYYPVVTTSHVSPTSDEVVNKKPHNIINNVLLTLPSDQANTRTLNIHQVNNTRQRDYNTLNKFNTSQRSQKIYL